MGATSFMHRFTHHDWRMGVRELQRQAEEEYGHRQGYSGAINSCHHISLHRPNRVFRDMKDVSDYVRGRLELLDKREGEVMDLGVIGFSIARPVVHEFRGYFPYDPRLLRGRKEPAALLTVRGFPLRYGTLGQLKTYGMELVLNEKFEHDYYIVSRNTDRVYVVTGEGRMVKSTTRKSGNGVLVLPYHEWVVYGWAAE